MQKLPERAGSARSRADRVPIPRVEGVEAARNRDFGDLDVFWSAGEDLVSAKSSSSGRDHVLDIVCGSMNKARPFVFALRAVAYDPNAEIECGNGRRVTLDGVAIHDRLHPIDTLKWWPRVNRDASTRYVQGHHFARVPRLYAFSPPQRGHVPVSTSRGTAGLGTSLVWPPFRAPSPRESSRPATFHSEKKSTFLKKTKKKCSSQKCFRSTTRCPEPLGYVSWWVLRPLVFFLSMRGETMQVHKTTGTRRAPPPAGQIITKTSSS